MLAESTVEAWAGELISNNSNSSKNRASPIGIPNLLTIVKFNLMFISHPLSVSGY
jgi:hypothetical protein